MCRLSFYMLLCLLLSCKTENPNQPKAASAMVEIDTIMTKAVAKVVPPKKEVRKGWKEITSDSFTKLDLRYATDNNFVDEQMYECGRCFVREEAYGSFSKIRAELQEKGIGIILYDCYRPKPVQQKLWDKVPNASYVTPPARGSMHNRGVALDIGLIDTEGNILDMGTEFDFFGREGHHDYYDHPEEVLKNRKLLKTTMEKHNFASIRTEWWHYSYVIGEYTIADWQWDCQ